MCYMAERRSWRKPAVWTCCFCRKSIRRWR
ncbi:hypothetical protein [Staphylococcus phage vB_SauM-V1SA19]|nr:hypothetical protein [Staphylococcus phage vB_SauM-V1SA19]